MIEPLEPRIAPATLLNPRTVSYIDPDGDAVRVTISKGTWDLANDFVFAASGAGEQLQLINLAGKTEFAGASITVSAAGPGDGFGHVGYIDATLIDLGTVKIDGDLGRIFAGNSIFKTPGIVKLDVHSIGRFGVTTQAPGGTLFTGVSGPLGSLKVTEDIEGGAWMSVGSLNSAQIGGDLFGNGDNFSGSIVALANIGSVQIGKNIIGGSGDFSGRIESGGKIGSVRVGLQVAGGPGKDSASIHAARGIGSVKIGQGLFGGSGVGSGAIVTDTEALGSVVLGEAIFGGTAANSGRIFSGGTIGLVQTGKNGPGKGYIYGGPAPGTGTIGARDGIAQLLINGELRGGTGLASGMIEVSGGRLDKLVITGDFKGADVTGAASIIQSGYILAEDIGSISIGGNFQAGSRLGAGQLSKSGEIHSNHAIASLVVGGGIFGGSDNPAMISAIGAVNPTTTKDLAIGEIRVGQGITLANILAGYDEEHAPKNIDAQIGKISVKKDVVRTNFVAGTMAGADAQFGTVDDAPIPGVTDQPGIVARIARIEIGGVVNGNGASGDVYGFEAGEIGFLRIAGKNVALHPGPYNDTLIPIAATTADVFVHEV